MEIANASVLITGAAQRIGAVLVRRFAAAGARVIIHCNQSIDSAKRLLEEIGGENAGHSILCCDLAKPENIPAMFNDVPRDVSILINNAYTFNRQGILNEPLTMSKEQFDLNFWTPVELMRNFYQHSIPAELSVVNLLDQAIVKTAADSFSYSLSKKALAEATRCAALQYAPRMRVNGLAPGPVFPPRGLEHLKMEKTLKTLPLGRPVNPQDLANACLMLAGCSSMTGSVLFVDCGQSLL